jgi:hypothetical protein
MPVVRQGDTGRPERRGYCIGTSPGPDSGCNRFKDVHK